MTELCRYESDPLVIEEIDDDGNPVVVHDGCSTTIPIDKPQVSDGYKCECGVRYFSAAHIHTAYLALMAHRQAFPTLVKPARSDSSSS